MALEPPRTEPLRFLPGIASKLGWYVYALSDPREGMVFYVGKGRGDRAYQHAVHAANVDADATPASLKLSTIREIRAAGFEPGVEIVRHGLADSDQAYEVEAAVIDALRLIGVPLTNAVRGHGTKAQGWAHLDELVARYEARPTTIPPEMRVVLIRINKLYRPGMTEEELYERTRKWWRKDARRKPDYAFAVYNGIVRAVYKIEGWHGPGPDELDDRTRNRVAFTGTRDPGTEELYLWSHLGDYLTPGAQNPLRYINC